MPQLLPQAVMTSIASLVCSYTVSSLPKTGMVLMYKYVGPDINSLKLTKIFTKFKHLRPSGFFPSSYMFVFWIVKYTFEHIYKVNVKVILRDIFYLSVFNFFLRDKISYPPTQFSKQDCHWGWELQVQEAYILLPFTAWYQEDPDDSGFPTLKRTELVLLPSESTLDIISLWDAAGAWVHAV